MSLNLLLHRDFHVSARCSALQHQLRNAQHVPHLRRCDSGSRFEQRNEFLGTSFLADLDMFLWQSVNLWGNSSAIQHQGLNFPCGG